jgi:hypothetical protein
MRSMTDQLTTKLAKFFYELVSFIVYDKMRRERKPIKLSVSKLVTLLVEPNQILHPTVQYIPKESLEQARLLHVKFGYIEAETYRRFYEYENELFEVIGTPDKVNRVEGIVEEFKTYRSNGSRIIQMARGKEQLILYCFITGMPRARLTTYDVVNRRVDVFGDFDVTYQRQLYSLNKALHRYVRIRASSR